MTKSYFERELMKRGSNTLEVYEALQKSLQRLKKRVYLFTYHNKKYLIVDYKDVEKVFGEHKNG